VSASRLSPQLDATLAAIDCPRAVPAPLPHTAENERASAARYTALAIGVLRPTINRRRNVRWSLSQGLTGLGYATFSSVTVRPESWALLAKYRGLAQAHRREARRLEAFCLAVAA
jgi:hypothetical protein